MPDRLTSKSAIRVPNYLRFLVFRDWKHKKVFVVKWGGTKFAASMSALGQKADICGAKRHLRFTPKSGHWAWRVRVSFGFKKVRRCHRTVVCRVARAQGSK